MVEELPLRSGERSLVDPTFSPLLCILLQNETMSPATDHRQDDAGSVGTLVMLFVLDLAVAVAVLLLSTWWFCKYLPYNFCVELVAHVQHAWAVVQKVRRFRLAQNDHGDEQ